MKDDLGRGQVQLAPKAFHGLEAALSLGTVVQVISTMSYRLHQLLRR